MSSKIKNIIILVVVAIALVLIYIFFIRKGPEAATLTSTSGAPVIAGTDTTSTGTQVSKAGDDFVAVLLSVKSIKLNDDIFKDPAFISLRDSSITLVQDGNEGRLNPFAPIGSEATASPVNPNPIVDTGSSSSSPIDNKVSTDTSTNKTSGKKN